MSEMWTNYERIKGKIWINYEWNMNNLWTKWYKLWIICEQSDWFAISLWKKLYMIEQNMNKLWIK